jgi:hypothetical protein
VKHEASCSSNKQLAFTRAGMYFLVTFYLFLLLSLQNKQILLLFYFIVILFYFYCNVFFLSFADLLTGQVTTLAGSSNGFQDGIGSNAKLNRLIGMCLNPHDNCLYVSDFANHKIRKVTMNGIDLIFDLGYFFITTHLRINIGEVSSIEVKRDLIQYPRGYCQSLFVACLQTVTPSGTLIICFHSRVTLLSLLSLYLSF